MTKTDEQLYREMCAGQVQAFDALYERFERRLFGFLLSLLKNREDAEEAFHDVFQTVIVAAREQRDSPEGAPARFDAWLFTVAKHRALNRLRARQTAVRLVELERDDGQEPKNVETELLDRSRQVALTVALDGLPPQLREVYRMRAEGLSYEDMATRLRVPVGTVKSRIHALVGRLKREMKQWAAR